MLIAEELFLISIDEDSKKNELKSLPVLLAGAILHDLKHQKIISILQTDSLIKGPLVHIENTNNTGSSILDEVINTMSSKNKNFPIHYWLVKLKGKKFSQLIPKSLAALNIIQLSGKKYEVIKPENKAEIAEKIINSVLNNKEPDENLRNLLMLLCLRTVNWDILPKQIDIKDEKVKFRLTTFQEMNWKDEIGFYLTNLVPKTVYRKTSGARVVKSRTKL